MSKRIETQRSYREIKVHTSSEWLIPEDIEVTAIIDNCIYLATTIRVNDARAKNFTSRNIERITRLLHIICSKQGGRLPLEYAEIFANSETLSAARQRIKSANTVYLTEENEQLKSITTTDFQLLKASIISLTMRWQSLPSWHTDQHIHSAVEQQQAQEQELKGLFPGNLWLLSIFELIKRFWNRE